MPIIDSQVHAYEANTPKRPWHTVPNWPPSATGDETVAAMDRLGIDGAVFISSFSMYGYDASYAVEVQKAHPGRFGLVKPVDPDRPDVEDIIARMEHLRRYGVGPDKLRQYPGLKEEYYLADFKPDPAIPGALGVEPDRILVVLHPGQHRDPARLVVTFYGFMNGAGFRGGCMDTGPVAEREAAGVVDVGEGRDPGLLHDLGDEVPGVLVSHAALLRG